MKRLKSGPEAGPEVGPEAGPEVVQEEESVSRKRNPALVYYPVLVYTTLPWYRTPSYTPGTPPVHPAPPCRTGCQRSTRRCVREVSWAQSVD